MAPRLRGTPLALSEFPDLEDFRPAVGADTLDRRATIFHRHLFGVLDLNLLALFDAVTLRHVRTPFAVASRQSCADREGGLRRM